MYLRSAKSISLLKTNLSLGHIASQYMRNFTPADELPRSMMHPEKYPLKQYLVHEPAPELRPIRYLSRHRHERKISCPFSRQERLDGQGHPRGRLYSRGKTGSEMTHVTFVFEGLLLDGMVVSVGEQRVMPPRVHFARFAHNKGTSGNPSWHEMPQELSEGSNRFCRSVSIRETEWRVS
jgi:hypothetical protein